VKKLVARLPDKSASLRLAVLLTPLKQLVLSTPTPAKFGAAASPVAALKVVALDQWPSALL
jgi:hypothetical protein